MKNYLYILILLLTSGWGYSATIKVGLGEIDYAPFYFTNKDNKLTGASIEIAEAISAIAGDKIKYYRFPWNRTQSLFNQGKIDLMILYFKSDDRVKFAYYTENPYIFEKSQIFTSGRSKSEKFDGTIASISTSTFANVKGYSHGKEYDQNKKLKKFLTKNEVSLLKMVENQRVQYGVGNKQVLAYVAKKAKIGFNFNFLSPPIDIGKNYMAFSKKSVNSKKNADRYSGIINKFMKSSKYKAILKKYDLL